MKNKDLKNKEELEIKSDMKEAIESGDSEAFVEAQTALAKSVEERILEEAKNAKNEGLLSELDKEIMAARGLDLTAEEREFYNEVIDGDGFDGTEKMLPATVFDRVFDNLRKNHPLLSEIEFKNTTAVTEWITRTSEAEAAWWGSLTAEIQKKLSASFKKEDTDLYKLSAYMPVAKAMLDLGPEWLDRFVREVLYESIALALEMAIVDGTGDGEPIGMNRDLEGAVVEGVYPKKTASPLTDFEPGTLGQKIMAPLTKEGERAVPEALILVNPLDYWERIFAETTYLTADKSYVYGVLPIPAKIIQSVAVDKGELIAGVARDYFMGIGSNQKIEFSDHYKFLEDERTYITKQYANGKPLDNESFLLFNISNMDPAVVTALSSLSLGSLSLSPSFDAETVEYTTTTTDSSNNIKGVAESDDASVAIAVDGESHDNDTAYTWTADSENVVTITVTNESEAQVYTVTVTHSSS